jgi:HAE1 family hydrophobic/amphiphilic exporter-1
MLIGLPDDAQPGIDALADLPIPAADGTTVPLSSVAAVTVARTQERIRRENRQTTSWVAVELDKDKVTTEQGQQMVSERMQGFVVPEGYSWDFGQWGRDRDQALGTMLRGVLLSLLVVILLMAALFESISDPFAIIVTLMLAFFGAFWSLWLFGYQLDPISCMGIIILIGIVVNNGIVMVDHVNALRRRGLDRREALLKGCGERLRPVAMTAITTVVGLLPLALFGASVASVPIESIAVAVVGGLSTSTVFTLLALPVWYSTLEDALGLAVRALPRRLGPRHRSRREAGVLADVEAHASSGT